MIRTVPIPTRVSRMGAALVQAGDGGSAAQYTFDSDGLSNDPRLSYPLQSLTYAQLQTALDGGDPLPGLISLINQDITGTGAGSLPCGGANNPTCGPPLSPNSIPSWVWYAGAALGAIALIGVIRK